MSLRLRHATARDHKIAERATGLSARRTDRVTVGNFLARFCAFQTAAEAWLIQSPVEREFLLRRQRASLMARDLERLGTKALPPRFDFAFGVPDRASAFGMLYVIEGARMGGRHIDGWLARTNWYPPEGFACFRCPENEALWQETCAALDALDDDLHAPVIAAAQRSFATLADWFEAPH